MAGLASLANQLNTAFNKEYLTPGYVKYVDKNVEGSKISHPQRLDDLFGIFKSFAISLSGATAERKKATNTALAEYHYKAPSARAYLVYAQGNGTKKVAGNAKTPVQWYDERIAVLDEKVQDLHLVLNKWT